MAASLEHAPRGVRHIAAAVIGNALECYDFIVYSYFAVQIGRAFFPGHTAFASLMLSLATFGAGFVSRPLGAVVIGRLGDRVGRKPAMLLSFTLMGVSMLAMACMPTYARVGVAAPLLVLAARLTQGFAMGGDIGSTTTYLLEAAPASGRGLATAWQLATQGVATVASGLVGLAVTRLSGPEALQAWGWRAAFLLGALILPFGLALRRGMPETLEAATETPLGALLRSHGRMIGLAFLIIGNINVSYYVLAYMTTYATTTLHMTPAAAFGAPIMFGLCTLAFSLGGGALSDRIGRRAVMIWPRLALLLIAAPAFWLVARRRDTMTLLAATAVLAALSQAAGAAALVAVTEALPRSARCLALSVIYASAAAVFGALTQPILAWLLHTAGGGLAPAYLLMGATAMGLAAITPLRETAPAKLDPALA
ncbi:MAG TPA: MFS transporter [Caulobacteraceae bacterium]|jgi:MFS family permease|nr:MFS transporter [Caulobacteraceae bacterium]